ncbi:transposase [Streptomyces sp. NPDC020983]|uniref:transposase n=1 Tax=Streptomyces sp. NPDC020983 TaxID=3365106 RepID=UPI0037B90871
MRTLTGLDRRTVQRMLRPRREAMRTLALAHPDHPVDTLRPPLGAMRTSRKRFIVTDTLGLLLTVHVVAASLQDREGAKRSLLWTRLDNPTVTQVWADQGFAGRLVQWAADILRRDLDIVRKQPGQRGFQVQPERWAVERPSAWITMRRRMAGDHERDPSETMIRWAMTDVILRRPRTTRHPPRSNSYEKPAHPKREPPEKKSVLSPRRVPATA